MNILKKDILKIHEEIANKKTLSLFIGYVLFAGIATIVDIGALYTFTSIVGFHYLVSSMIGYSLGMVTNYSLNKVYNFKDKSERIIRQFAIFVSVALVGLAINMVILFVLVDYFTVWYFGTQLHDQFFDEILIGAKIVSVGVVMIWSFIGHKLFTFKAEL